MKAYALLCLPKVMVPSKACSVKVNQWGVSDEAKTARGVRGTDPRAFDQQTAGNDVP